MRRDEPDPGGTPTTSIDPLAPFLKKTAIQALLLARRTPEKASQARDLAVERVGEAEVRRLDALSNDDLLAELLVVGRLDQERLRQEHAAESAAAQAAWAEKLAAERRRAEVRIASAARATLNAIARVAHRIRALVSQPRTSRTHRSARRLVLAAAAASGGGSDGESGPEPPAGPRRLGVLHLENLKPLIVAVLVCALASLVGGYVVGAIAATLLPAWVAP